MKLPKIKIPKIRIKLTVVLWAIFLLVVLVEAWVLYDALYLNPREVVAEPDQPSSDLVEIDFARFESVSEWLDEREDYEAVEVPREPIGADLEDIWHREFTHPRGDDALTLDVAAPRQAEHDGQLIAMWLHGRPATTRQAYQRHVGRFLAMTGKPLAMITVGDVQSFHDSMAHLAPTATRASRPSSRC